MGHELTAGGFGRRALAACVSLAVFGACLVPACGLETVGAGKALDAGGGPDAAAAADAALPIADGGVEQPVETCAAPKVACGEDCVDTKTDSRHCGACDKPCPAGEACVASKCEVLCAVGVTACGGTCVDTKTDPKHCGGCNKPCDAGTPLCSAGRCVIECDAGLDLCNGPPMYCADLSKDPKNCGACGRSCAVNEVCNNKTCVPVCATNVTPGDFFGGKMVGCRGTVAFGDRATLCPPGVPVCKATDYVTKAAGKKPTFNYWTNDALEYRGSDQYCAVSTNTQYYYRCNPQSSPMRVCAGYKDALGNTCNWIGCGYETGNNQYFGGCNGNRTAGALCCPP